MAIRKFLKLTVGQSAAALGLTATGAAPGTATLGLGSAAPAAATATHCRHCSDFKCGSHTTTGRRRRRSRSASRSSRGVSRHICSTFYRSVASLKVSRGVGYTGGATAVRFATVGLLALSTQGGHGFLVGTPMLRGIRLAFCDPRS